MIQLKVCCIRSLDEALLALHHGATALGLVSSMPSGPGVIDEGLIADIAAAVRRLPRPPQTFLLTPHTQAEAIAEQHARVGTTTLQLVDDTPVDELRRLRRLCPGVGVVQVVHVTGPASVDAARTMAPWVDALLLDSGNPALAVKELGGTGRTHDWAVSRAIVEAVDRPVFLAGGLRAHNIGEAIRQVRPHGVDLCTGVRTGDRLDAERLRGFVQALRAAEGQGAA